MSTTLADWVPAKLHASRFQWCPGSLGWLLHLLRTSSCLELRTTTIK